MSVYNYSMFIQDEEGQWYKIPVSQKENFEKWIELNSKPSCQVEDEDFAGLPDFYFSRCMHPCNYMFKDIQVLKESKI